MIRFIDEHRDQFGVEFLCRVLRDAVPRFLTSRGYRAAKTRVPSVAGTLRAEVLPLQALNMAAWGARGSLDDLVHHADHGSNYLSVVYTDRINELGATPSTGSVGDSYDNALAEAVNGLYKTELIRRKGPWRTVEQVELATLEYVWWWNNARLHGELDYQRFSSRNGTPPIPTPSNLFRHCRCAGQH